jgi:adenylate cyclase
MSKILFQPKRNVSVEKLIDTMDFYSLINQMNTSNQVTLFSQVPDKEYEQLQFSITKIASNGVPFTEIQYLHFSSN